MSSLFLPYSRRGVCCHCGAASDATRYLYHCRSHGVDCSQGLLEQVARGCQVLRQAYVFATHFHVSEEDLPDE